MTLRLTRRQYADLYGPTVGDQVRLADTELFIEVERDFATAREVAATLKQHGILVQVVAAQTLRACLHLDVTAAQAEQAAETSRRSLASLTPVR